MNVGPIVDTFFFTIEISDITNLTMIHIHAGNASSSGPIVVPLVPKPEDYAIDGMLATPRSSSGSQPLNIRYVVSSILAVTDFFCVIYIFLLLNFLALFCLQNRFRPL